MTAKEISFGCIDARHDVEEIVIWFGRRSTCFFHVMVHDVSSSVECRVYFVVRTGYYLLLRLFCATPDRSLDGRTKENIVWYGLSSVLCFCERAPPGRKIAGRVRRYLWYGGKIDPSSRTLRHSIAVRHHEQNNNE
jgi:hypothetical protein